MYSFDPAEYELICDIIGKIAEEYEIDSNEFINKFAGRMEEFVEVKPRPKTYTIRFLQRLLVPNADSSAVQFLNTGSEEQIKLVLSKKREPLKKNDYLSKSSPVVSGSDSASWAPPKREKKIVSELDSKLNKIRSDINKLAPSNYEKLSARICESITEECLSSISIFFFGEGLLQTAVRETYSKLCFELCQKFPLFCEILYTQCKKEFNVVLDEDLEDELIIKTMKKRISVGQFVVELFRNNAFKISAVIDCIKILLDYNKPLEYNVCHAVEIIMAVMNSGVSIKIIKKTSPYCDTLNKYYTDNLLTNRAKFKVEEMVAIAKAKKIL